MIKEQVNLPRILSNVQAQYVLAKFTGSTSLGGISLSGVVSCRNSLGEILVYEKNGKCKESFSDLTAFIQYYTFLL